MRAFPRIGTKRPLWLVAFVLTALLGTAHAHGPTRQKVTETIDINAPAEVVWALIENFADAASWLPMVESSTGEGGNEKGATRVLTLAPGVQLFETLKKYNAEKMMYSYKIPAATHDVKVLPVTNYSSTISVKANGDNSVVTWKGAFYRGYPNNDPPPELNEEAAITAVTGVYQAGLSSLKKLAEAQN